MILRSYGLLLAAVFSVVISGAYASAASLSQPDPAHSVLWVDIRDLAEFSPQAVPEASFLAEEMRKNFGQFFPANTTKIYGVELTELPVALVNGNREISFQAHIRLSNGEEFFRRLRVEIGGNPMRVANMKSLGEDIPLNRVSFQINVSLIERKLILTDSQYKIKKIYPIGVGSFDMGVSPTARGSTRLVTNLFLDASINQSTAERARTSPSYYKGKPFMPITTQRGTNTNFAFHIEVNNRFIRGFDSHGCMRVREKDLMELYAILMGGASKKIPVNVSYEIADLDDHPAPKVNDSYQRVKNFGSAAQPQLRRDGHNLVILERVKGEPPVELLK